MLKTVIYSFLFTMAYTIPYKCVEQKDLKVGQSLKEFINNLTKSY